MAFQAAKLHVPSSMKASLAKGTGQREVWDRVALAMNAAETFSSTEDLTSALSSRRVQKERERLAPVEEKIRGTGGVRGIVALLGGKVRSVEVFSSTSYFKNEWSGLFSSLVMDAVVEEEKREAVKGDPVETALDFFGRLKTAQALTRERGGMKTVYIQGMDIIGEALLDPEEDRLVHLGLFPDSREGRYPGSRGRRNVPPRDLFSWDDGMEG